MGKFSKDKRDIFYRLAKEAGYRARSAFKLLQIDEEFHLLEGIHRAVDLCAAPGSWTQVLSKKLKENVESKNHSSDGGDVCIVSVDLQPMVPVEGVSIIQGDITRENTVGEIIEKLNGKKAQIVVSDGAPDIIGRNDVDEFVQHQLVLSALNITLRVLEEGGTFVAKVFRGSMVRELYAFLQKYFAKVYISKPKASRNSSLEGFIVCEKYKPPSFFPSMSEPLLLPTDLLSRNEHEGKDEQPVPFVACGTTCKWDSDQTYPLLKESNSDSLGAAAANDDKVMYSFLEPKAPPLAPPYQTFLEMKRSNKLKK